MPRVHTRVRSVTTAVLTALGTLVVAAVVVTGGGTAHAAEVGTLTLDPATGTDVSLISFTTHSTSGTGCPAGTTNVSAKAFGPGAWAAGLIVLGNTSSGVSTTADFTVPMSDTFSGISQSNSAPIVAGKYDIVLTCRDRLGSTTFGTMTGSIWFTTPTAYQSTDPTPVTSTPTPTTPTPTATTPTPDPTTPSPGPTQSTTPTPAPAAPSLVSAAALAGTPRVGSALTCGGSFSNATAVGYQWLRAGVAISGATGTAYTATGLDYAKPIACRITAVNGAGMSTSTSPAATVGIGVKLASIVKPVITGKTGLGKVLKVSRGTWKPVAATYTYQWLRDGKKIKGATAAAHKVVKADRHHKLAAKVTALNIGYATGSVVSKVRAIP